MNKFILFQLQTPMQEDLTCIPGIDDLHPMLMGKIHSELWMQTYLEHLKNTNFCSKTNALVNCGYKSKINENGLII